MRINIVFLFILMANLAHAGSLLDVVKEDDFLMQGGLAIISYSGDRYLVSVGIAPINFHHPVSTKKAMIESKAKAQQQLSQFINENVVETSEVLEAKTVVHEQNSSPSRMAASRYSEKIRVTDEGPLKNILPVGNWSSSSLYYHAICIKISDYHQFSEHEKNQ